MDTAAARASALSVDEPWLILVVPDGTIDQSDRQTLVDLYAEISAFSATLEFTAGPTAINTLDTRVVVRFTATGLNPIQYRACVLANLATAPDANEVLTLTGDAASPVSSIALSECTSEVSEQFTLSGLTAETAYDVYVAIDDPSSDAVLGTRIDITTSAAITGGFVLSAVTPIALRIGI